MWSSPTALLLSQLQEKASLSKVAISLVNLFFHSRPCPSVLSLSSKFTSQSTWHKSQIHVRLSNYGMGPGGTNSQKMRREGGQQRNEWKENKCV